MIRYAIVIEKVGDSFSAYVPDLPGCVASGASIQEVEREIRNAIVFHIEGMRDDGIEIPTPTSTVEYLDIAV